jgi:hypothetical protein
MRNQRIPLFTSAGANYNIAAIKVRPNSANAHPQNESRKSTVGDYNIAAAAQHK